MGDAGGDVGNGAKDSRTAASGSGAADVDDDSALPSWKDDAFLQRSRPRGISMGGQEGSSPSSFLARQALRAPPPIFAGRSPWSMETTPEPVLPHQLNPMILVAAAPPQIGAVTTSFGPHRTIPMIPNHVPDPRAFFMVGLVDRVLWNPGTLGERAGEAARWAAQAEDSSQYWQDLLKAGDRECVDRTIDVLLWCVFEIMSSQSAGHHLFKRLVDACGKREAQLGRLVDAVAARPSALVESARQKNGRRCVEKLLVTVRPLRRLLRRLTEALSFGAADLMMDECGRILVETCLTRLNAEQNKFIFAAAMRNVKKIAKDKHGSPSLTNCIKHAPYDIREALVNMVISMSACLAQDPYGNYVVQGVMDLVDEEYTGRLCCELRNHCVNLAKHKNGSHVLERCVRAPEGRRHIAEALVFSGKLGLIARDSYGNYVIQTLIKEGLSCLRRQYSTPSTVASRPPSCPPPSPFDPLPPLWLTGPPPIQSSPLPLSRTSLPSSPFPPLPSVSPLPPFDPPLPLRLGPPAPSTPLFSPPPSPFIATLRTRALRNKGEDEGRWHDDK
ncbi:hypothetical protein Taro_027451 [Colocasia esculenta]|uniref:PUM-HD domain-containing protein n=1 Tax=Colocasia esculenta TaxID=4460 RepID=A0A843VI42_COLES|nr:hypothetical protein [Colocasia esculenta]